jgi:RimJ/RimL family protein N-acetyltransferase
MELSHPLIELPTLYTERLQLRPFRLSDANDVQRLVGDREVAENTMVIPHPYEDGMAESWIETHVATFDAGKNLNLAVVLRESGELAGAIGLEFHPDHQNAELGYWIGRPFWGNGYCSEAARAMLDYSFRERNLHRVHAKHYRKNPASGRVMEKIGMKLEGVLREHIFKWGKFEDAVVYGILRSEFLEQS